MEKLRPLHGVAGHGAGRGDQRPSRIKNRDNLVGGGIYTITARVRKTPCEGRGIARYGVSIGQGPNLRSAVPSIARRYAEILFSEKTRTSSGFSRRTPDAHFAGCSSASRPRPR